jgi:hypothetical protein
MTTVKLPRRAYQRRKIRKHPATALPKGQVSNIAAQTHKFRARVETKAARASQKHESDPEPNSDYTSDCGSVFEHKGDKDSGYSSNANNIEVAESYEEIRARFATEGPVMRELADRSKEMVKAEELLWKA